MIKTFNKEDIKPNVGYVTFFITENNIQFKEILNRLDSLGYNVDNIKDRDYNTIIYINYNDDDDNTYALDRDQYISGKYETNKNYKTIYYRDLVINPLLDMMDNLDKLLQKI